MAKRILLFILILISSELYCQSSGGILGSNTVVCEGNNNGVLTVSSYSGSIIRWEYAYNSSGPWTPMVFTASSYNYINLVQSTYFRTVVQLTGYPEAYSNLVLVTCNSISNSGSVSGNTFQCVNSPATFSLSGNTGSVIAWEYSSNNWISTNTITTANITTATLSNLTTTIQVRAKVQSGVCPVVSSNPITILPAPNTAGGSVSGSTLVCAGSNTPSFSLGSYTGSVLQWENASAAGGPFNAVSATAGSASLALSNVSQSQWYRVLVKNGTCPSAYSSTLALQVDDPSVGGSIVGTQQVCAGINSGTVQLVANTGQVVQWESSVNTGASWTILSNTTANQTFTNIMSTYLFRTLVQNGICPPVYSSQFTVNVNVAPSPSFNVNNACVQSMTSFSNATFGNNSYSWAFGDGGSSGIQNPGYFFQAPGTYTVKLVATSMQNCTDSLKKSVVIYPKPSPSLFSSDTLCYGSSILFTNASSISSGSIVQSVIKFGDGSNSTASPVNHFYNSAGNYSVYIVTTSNFGCKDSVGKNVSVYPKPYANFTASSACYGTPIVFNNLSTVLNGGLSQLWSFGNSASSVVQSPSYLYPSPGSYTVSLISISSHNCTDTIFKSVNVYEKPSLTFSATTACFGDLVNYTVVANPAQTSHTFSIGFGDGNTSFNPVSSHLYSSPGTFVSNVTVTTDSGCVSSISKNIVVNSKPFANFNVNNACNADTLRFNNTSFISSGNMNYLWDLSGISSSTLNSPSFLYSNPGSYTVSLIVTSNFGCSDTIVKPLSVFDSPKGDFLFSNSCDGFPVTFTNVTSVNSGVVSLTNWDFGDN
ncbi:MAG: PKD domain-containing protein, partial [Bacteroidia bacterium]|nr:PKD domain-containing protein [Bacteroidia bacterium]